MIRITTWAILALALLLTSGPPTVSACPPLESASTSSTGRHPDGLAAGDVNGDGVLDLVVSSWDGDDVSVLLGDGHGSFASGPHTPVGNGPGRIVLADWNGDGKLDLAVDVDFDAEARIFLGNGNGTFTWRQSVHGDAIQSLAAADFNADGHRDLAILDMFWYPPDPPSGGFASVYLGNGDGTIHFADRFTTLEFPSSIAAADLNADGHVDLVVGSPSRSGVSVLLGVGNGTFSAQTPYATGPPSGVEAGDVDGDGGVDIVTANAATDDVSVLLGLGDGTFQSEKRYPSGDGPFAVAVVDLFGRGRGDVVTANEYGDTLSVQASLGDGSVGPAAHFPVGDVPAYIAVADFDADGRPDTAVANYQADTVSVLLNTSDRPWITFQTPGGVIWPAFPGALRYDVYRGALADLVDADGDGRPDAGYGVCGTAQDPDPSDTTFLDLEIPPESTGFFYLVDVIAPDGSRGVGVTSDCLPRLPAAACP